MYLTRQQLAALDEAGLRAFLDTAVPECLYLDYKISLSGSSDKDAKREFLKDVTAFANAGGGQLLLGVKEPADDLSVDDQLIGVEGAEALAQDLERLCSASIDPRIPGLCFFRVPLSNERGCLIVHVPPSLSRPHMVTHQGHRTFYVRHSESCFPMTTHEIREAVLQSATSEMRVRQRIADEADRIRQQAMPRKPLIFLQAVPLVPVEPKWDVFSETFDSAIRAGASNSGLRDYANLRTSLAPKPTIYGLRTQDDHSNPLWRLNAHRDGYLSLVYTNIATRLAPNVERPVVHSGTCDVFRAFCWLLAELQSVTGTDTPCVISGHLFNAKGISLWTERPDNKFTEPYPDDEIIWPEHVRSTGSDLTEIAESISRELFYAFGFKQISQ